MFSPLEKGNRGDEAGTKPITTTQMILDIKLTLPRHGVRVHTGSNCTPPWSGMVRRFRTSARSIRSPPTFPKRTSWMMMFLSGSDNVGPVAFCRRMRLGHPCQHLVHSGTLRVAPRELFGAPGSFAGCQMAGGENQITAASNDVFYRSTPRMVSLVNEGNDWRKKKSPRIHRRKRSSWLAR